MRKLFAILVGVLLSPYAYGDCSAVFTCFENGCKPVVVSSSCKNQVNESNASNPGANNYEIINQQTSPSLKGIIFGDQSNLLTNNARSLVNPENRLQGHVGVPQTSTNILLNPITGKQFNPAVGLGCAENGSCYGDTSTVNGLPKTIHINGYYRKDGTYVRGHYRSK